MKLKNTFRKKLSVYDWFFILSGGYTFMMWLLPTNPQSYNPLIRMWWKKDNRDYTAYAYENRLYGTIYLGLFHVTAFFFFICRDIGFISNLLGNVYPIMVQIYVGLKCYKILQHKKKYH